ncbi:uncharacterized protein MELLADRAFT_102581 [Melampsora larici-populina 98AG31]|uniref:Uncharacterized protein n=1 Tax=Melampsora larici-populina (strain 98AG31 / pathotype 3-4-7) TaxID=747676 RepID=F4R788_MELLP|nr:uncharacterized protein MELLADRAFT_102581 [Melampsora larici-populina 98AG31]EGG11562.1 hypothetical protein MELLADRAFT_102581 [Melampsora larici-populina 98AG31]
MADHTSLYVYPVKSVVLPKRLHRFLSYHVADPILDATTREYHQIIEVFHPKLALPLNLGKEVVIQLFQIMVLPFLRRQKSFDKDTCVFSYISIVAHTEHEKPYPTRSLVLPQNVKKYIAIYDDPNMIFDATVKEIFTMIDVFFPQLQIPRFVNQETIRSIFDIIVLPFFHRFVDHNKDSGYIRFLTVEVLPLSRPEKGPIKAVTLPVSLHSLLVYLGPVSVLAEPTNQQIHQILHIFHPHLSEYWELNRTGKSMMPVFNLMVLPYLRHALSFNFHDNKLTYCAVDLSN